MEISQAAISSPILLLAGVLLFLLLFAVILQTLKMSSLFSGGVSYLMATCVSLLCVFSLFRTFVDEKVIGKGGKGEMVDFILLHTLLWQSQSCLCCYSWVSARRLERGDIGFSLNPVTHVET
jgi:hypothetical protein